MFKKIRKIVRKSLLCLVGAGLLVNTLTLNTYALTGKTGVKIYDEWMLVDPISGEEHGNEGYLLVDGKEVFCVDYDAAFHPNRTVTAGTYKDIGINESKAKRLSLIAYYGTKVKGRTGKDWYAITQGLLWREIHEKDNLWFVRNDTTPDYASTQKAWKEILSDVDRYYILPSFSSSSHTVDANKTVELNDTNKVLEDMTVVNDGGLDVSIRNNTLIIKGNSDTDEATIVLRKNIPASETGISVYYTSDECQSVASFKVSDPLQVAFKVKVNRLGKLELTKYNSDQSATVPDVSFRITGPDDYDQTFITDANGKIVIDDLESGDYQAFEIKAGYGYLLNVSKYSFTIRPSETSELSISNDEPKGRITVSKRDNQNSPLSGAVFKITAAEDITNKAKTKTYYHKGETVDTVTALEDGDAVSKLLPLGEYDVYEYKAPDGYLLNNERKHVSLKYRDQMTSIVYDSVIIKDNEPTGQIELIKSIDTSKTNGLKGDANLKDNTYELHAKDKITNKAGTKTFYEKDALVSSKKTDEDGKITWDNLPLGNYYIKEKSPNDTLVLNTSVINVSLEYEGQTVSKVITSKKTSNRVNMRKIQVFKSGEKEGISGFVKGLQGAEFTFKLKSEVDHVGWDNAQPYAIIITDGDGKANTPYLPHGEYLVKETKTPKDYITAPDFTISVTDDYSEYKDVEQVKRININNRPFTSQVKLVKVDKDSGKTITLNSASFKIKDSEGNYVTKKVSGIKIDTFTTNSKNQIVSLFGTKGEVTLPLELGAGTYFVEEIKTPEGFLELEEPISFTITNQYDYDVDEDETPILTVKIKNAQPHGKLVIKKTDKVTADPLENVEYELTAKENIINAIDGSIIYQKGTVVSKGKTNAQGNLTVNNLPLGKYELKETLTNEGYVLAEEVKDVVFEQKDTKTKEYVINVNMKNIKPHGEIHLEKTDKDTKELLGGVTFQLTAKENIYSLDGRNTLIYKAGDTVSKDISENGLYITDELGQINISDLSLGHYELKEVQTLKGYVPSKTVYDIDLSYDHTDKIIYTKQINVENEKTTTEISKINATDEKELAGAHLSLKDKDGNIIEEWVSGQEPHIIRGLLAGKEYILHEDLAPIGYATASDVTFTVNDDGTVTKVTMKDEITKLDISKVDATTSKEIEGAKLTLKDKETGEVIETWTSDKTPHRIEGLEAGETYILHEDLAPIGYEIADDVEFTVEDTGDVQKVIIKDELKTYPPETSDHTDIVLYMTVLLTAGLGAVVLCVMKGREKHEQ